MGGGVGCTCPGLGGLLRGCTGSGGGALGSVAMRLKVHPPSAAWFRSPPQQQRPDLQKQWRHKPDRRFADGVCGAVLRTARAGRERDLNRCRFSWRLPGVNETMISAARCCPYRRPSPVFVSVRLIPGAAQACLYPEWASLLTSMTSAMPTPSQIICATVSRALSRFCSCGIRSASAT